MIFTETKLKGAFVIDIEPREDERGFFGRSFCQREFAAHGLKTIVAQSNISFNKNKGTLRGMHFQVSPKAEAKLVRCIRGKMYDVIVDLRPESTTYCQWFGIELSADITGYGLQTTDHGSLFSAYSKMLYIPEGFAHGFQTLEDNTEVFYEMFEFYSPEHASGVRWDDPAFGISWPLPNPVMSDKDRAYKLWKR